MSVWRFKAGPTRRSEFYEGLEADNPRSTGRHTSRHTIATSRPLMEDLAELADEFGEGKIFRPNGM